jgi:hypothetical protein
MTACENRHVSGFRQFQFVTPYTVTESKGWYVEKKGLSITV